MKRSADTEDEMWSCPEHGDDNVATQTSMKGRTYRSCKPGSTDSPD